MRELKAEEIGRLKHGETTVQMRFVNEDGETEVWIVALGLIQEDANKELHALRTTILKKFIDDQVDVRLGNQANSIDRLTKHLLWHHEELGQISFESCTYHKRIQSGFEENA